MNLNETLKPFEVLKAKKLDIDPKEYFNFASRETSISREETFSSWIVNQGSTGFIVLPSQKNTFDYFFHKESTMKILKDLADYMQSNWEKHLSDYESKREDLFNKARLLGKSVKTGIREEIIEAYKEYLLKSQYKDIEFIYSPWAVIFFIEPEVSEALKDNPYFEFLALPEKPIKYFEMKRELLNRTSQEIAEKYGWLNMYSPGDQPFTKKDFDKIKAEASREEVESDLEKYQKVAEGFSKLVESIEDLELKQMCEIIHEYAFLKTDRIDNLRIANFYTHDFYKYLEKELGITLSESGNLFSEEVIDYLKSGKRPDKKILRPRAEGKNLYFYSDSKVYEIDDQPYIKDLRKRLFNIDSSKKELRGTIACKGKVRGKVKIIKHTSDLSKIERGDIFVAKYTFPTFTPAMFKSAAIITDDGGITSHAAIVSRESNIPCIVGTSIATQILKDGDQVEVDANVGIVRIIKRNEE